MPCRAELLFCKPLLLWKQCFAGASKMMSRDRLFHNSFVLQSNIYFEWHFGIGHGRGPIDGSPQWRWFHLVASPAWIISCLVVVVTRQEPYCCRECVWLVVVVVVVIVVIRFSAEEEEEEEEAQASSIRTRQFPMDFAWQKCRLVLLCILLVIITLQQKVSSRHMHLQLLCDTSLLFMHVLGQDGCWKRGHNNGWWWYLQQRRPNCLRTSDELPRKVHNRKVRSFKIAVSLWQSSKRQKTRRRKKSRDSNCTCAPPIAIVPKVHNEHLYQTRYVRDSRRAWWRKKRSWLMSWMMIL